MADEAATTTTDEAGLARTATGDLATPDSSTTKTESDQSTTQETGTTLLTETKKADAKAETKDGDKAKDGDKSKTGAPEAYADWKVPEGYAIDDELKGKVNGMFKGMNLTQEQGQQLLDFYVEQTKEAFQAPFDAYQEIRDGWRRDAENHPELRGKLGKDGDVVVRIGKFLSDVPDQELASDFRKLMDFTGAGNHPAFIRMVDYMARLHTEGGHAAGKGPSTHGQPDGQKETRTAAQAMYPNLPSAAT